MAASASACVRAARAASSAAWISLAGLSVRTSSRSRRLISASFFSTMASNRALAEALALAVARATSEAIFELPPPMVWHDQVRRQAHPACEDRRARERPAARHEASVTDAQKNSQLRVVLAGFVFGIFFAWGITAGRPPRPGGGYGSPPEQKRDHGKFLTCQTPVLYIRIHASKRETDAAPPFALVVHGGPWT